MQCCFHVARVPVRDVIIPAGGVTITMPCRHIPHRDSFVSESSVFVKLFKMTKLKILYSAINQRIIYRFQSLYEKLHTYKNIEILNELIRRVF